MLARIDHIVLNCRDVKATADWFERVLGLQREIFGLDQRIALKFGTQKINLRPIDAENWITSTSREAGGVDICFITEDGIESARSRLEAAGVEIILGPVTRAGSMGNMTSLYFRDPEGSLLEIASYDLVNTVE
jgi:catechol 2,3-dioxygenase-like lactoylglutathione lyase family enzyme